MVKRIGLTLGFTLIEMGIVLVVIGLILSGGLVAVAPVIQNSKISETNQRLDRIEQALIVHVVRYGCLPCPAAGATASTAAGAGQANGTYSSGCTATACAAVPTQGVVPWLNLGLSEADITDGFGTRIAYAVDNDLVATNSMRRTGITYPVANLEVDLNATPVHITDAAAGNGAAYVLISHGPNRHGGFRAIDGGAAVAAGTFGALETGNTDGTPFYQTDFNSSPAAYFDDIVRWRSAPIMVQLCGATACGNPA